MRYIGGKNLAGTTQRIISLIPPHRVYIEPFLGSGAILRHKRPAAVSIGIDKTAKMFPELDRAAPNLTLLQMCGIRFLAGCGWQGDEFVYCDPPYVLSTRGGRRYYEHEMEDADHVALLTALLDARAKVMISGYASELYDSMLAGWKRVEFTVYTRTHTARQEVIWMNYEAPAVPHDLNYIGRDYRDRWRLKRLQRRWRSRLERMKPAERALLAAELAEVGIGGEGPAVA